MYQAGTWEHKRRVVAKVEWHQGGLSPLVGFIVTNLSWRCKWIIQFYNQRGTAEQSIREGKNAVKWTRLSCHDFVDNHVRLAIVQPGQLSTPTSSATSHEDLDDDDLAGKVDQDRGQSGSACQVRHLSDGGGCGAAAVVPGDP